MTTENALKEIIDMMNDVCLMPKDYNSNINLETKTSDVIDSLDIVELSIEIEKNTNGKITDYTMENWKTIGDIVETYKNLKDNE
jgi:acyl carrier protein